MRVKTLVFFLTFIGTSGPWCLGQETAPLTLQECIDVAVARLLQGQQEPLLAGTELLDGSLELAPVHLVGHAPHIEAGDLSHSHVGPFPAPEIPPPAPTNG